jgi:hypothetical protein
VVTCFICTLRFVRERHVEWSRTENALNSSLLLHQTPSAFVDLGDLVHLAPVEGRKEGERGRRVSQGRAEKMEAKKKATEEAETYRMPLEMRKREGKSASRDLP